MGRPCTVCRHEQRHVIDIGLTNGLSARSLAERFGLSPDAVERHSENHLPPQARAAILAASKPSAIDLEELRRTESEGLLAGLVVQRARLLSRADAAQDLGDITAAVGAERAIAANYALVAKLLGQLINVHEVRSTNILLSPDYMRLRQVIVTTLRPWPEAARALAAAIHALESEAARDITAASSRPAAALPAPVVIDAEPAIPPCPVSAP